MSVSILECAVAVARGAAEVFCDGESVFFAELDDAASCFGCLATYLEYAAEEEIEPLFPFTFIANRLESFVVGLSVLFEVVRKVEDWFEEDFLLAEEEGDEESSDAAVSVEEGVDGFELGVGQADLDEQGKVGIGVEESFEVGHVFGNLAGRRGDVCSFVECAYTWADPGLACAVLAGSEV